MQNRELVEDYLKRATVRLEAVELLLKRQSYADVVRESQESVELALKSLLRCFGIQPPRIHDVSEVLLEERLRFPSDLQSRLEELTEISRMMRRSRELAFYGTEDLTPSLFYKEKDGKYALAKAKVVIEIVTEHVTKALS